MLRLLTEHWEVKIISALVAFALWFFVATREHSQVGLAAPVKYAGLAPQIVLVAGQRESVDVEVRATRSVVARLGPETVHVHVDLTGVDEGQAEVQLTPADVHVPPGTTVTRISPARLYLAVAAAGTGSATVVPQVHGTPASGYAVPRVSVEPPNVRIKGPRSTIETRGEVSTFPVDVSGSRRTVTQSVGLLLPASTYLTRERTVRVTVEIAEDGMANPQGAHAARKRATSR